MRHVILTCKNHPELRWSCKAVAWGPNGYNGSRSIFFGGVAIKNEDGTPKMYSDLSGLQTTQLVDNNIIEECDCSPKDLILAPEDSLVRNADHPMSYVPPDKDDYGTPPRPDDDQ